MSERGRGDERRDRDDCDAHISLPLLGVCVDPYLTLAGNSPMPNPASSIFGLFGPPGFRPLTAGSRADRDDEVLTGTRRALRKFWPVVPGPERAAMRSRLPRRMTAGL